MSQQTSELWKALWQEKGVHREYGFDVNGVWYGKDSEISSSVESELYSEFSIGNAASARMTLKVYADIIPRSATIKRFIRLVSEETGQFSEWLPKGVFFTNRRSEDDGLWTIEAFDCMKRGDVLWTPAPSLSFPLSMPDTVDEFCRIMQVELDPRTQLNPAYMVDYPDEDYTIRDVLRFIAAAHGGNWIVTDEGKLLLVPLRSFPEDNTHYLVTEYGAAITFGGAKILV